MRASFWRAAARFFGRCAGLCLDAARRCADQARLMSLVPEILIATAAALACVVIYAGVFA